MIIKAPAKINLGLHIKEKRTDGFHELESIFKTIPLFDFVELIPSKKDFFESYGLKIPGKSDSNLCLKALNLLRSNGYEIQPYCIHLLKNIPIGAGLGGGSSDAVAVLKGINKLENLDISTAELSKLAAELGSDCPFFLMDKTARAKGRGEILEDENLSLNGKFIHLVNPNIHISTAEAYGSLDLKHTNKTEVIVPNNLDDWQKSLVNDFEKALFPKHPVLQRIKETLHSKGAFYASMTGSGSTVFGLFDEKPLSKLYEDCGFSEWILQL